VRYLLDTSTFLWAATDPGRLSRRARRICESPRDSLAVSVVSFWEILIKCGSGGLRIADPARRLPDWCASLGARVLPIEAAHAFAVHGLPAIHRDPFDRLLVAQAMAEGLVMLSGDERVRQYPVRCAW
jgi:PIN domain nuclease of toxin-antitoxin system